MSSLYKRQFVLTAGMILISFALLGAAFFTLSYQYTIRQTKESMERNADYVANFTASVRSIGYSVEDEVYITMVATIARISDSYIITEALKNAEMANTVVYRQPNSLELLQEAGKLLRRLHDACMAHGDIKLANFYVQEQILGFWDLDSAMIFPKGTPLKWVVRDLGRLLSSFIL